MIAVSCNSRGDKNAPVEVQKPKQNIAVPKFNADSAYQFIKNQVEFGPRIPNSGSHIRTGKYLSNVLKKYGATVFQQDFDGISYDGQHLSLTNIIGSFYPERNKRIVLAAHWDTRPFADKDKEKPNSKFDGANDGGSGVGVLLEIARILKSYEISSLGVDIIFFDGEDWGERINTVHPPALPDDLKSWWCLGSQYWAKHKHKKNYAAFYGVLLDMVGAKRAKFYREATSLAYAPSIVLKIWNAADRLGYNKVFIKQNIGEITDDHLFVNEIGKIPMADIIQYDPSQDFFGDYHHTRKDNMALISKETLQAVGETVLTVLYTEE